MLLALMKSFDIPRPAGLLTVSAYLPAIYVALKKRDGIQERPLTCHAFALPWQKGLPFASKRAFVLWVHHNLLYQMLSEAQGRTFLYLTK